MSLTHTKKTKLNSQQKMRVADHHKKSKDYHKPYWPYLPVLMVVIVAFAINTLWLQRGVLDYAVDTTPSGLLAGTNTQRSSNGLGALALNSQLAQAAQAKANDMVTRNYWSHTTPDGQQPWVFITEAGYQYQTAGENLAYGFATSDETITGWMNSPGHRANILNTSYTEVGFGIANGANYQSNGNETVVVAMYASPLAKATPQVAPVTAPPAAAPTSTNPTTPVPATTPAEQAAPVAPIAPSANSDTVKAPAQKEQKTTVSTPAAHTVSRLEAVGVSRFAPWSAAALAVLLIGLGAFYITKHGRAWKRVIVHGEHFILKHKFLDILIVVTIAGGILLSQTVGFIQ